jgi:putative ABC transport system permease protein
MNLLQNAWPRRVPLAWLQLRHYKARLITAIAGVAFSNILVFMQLGFLGALQETAVLPHRSWKADLVLISAKARDLANVGTFPRRRMIQALGVPGVRQATSLHSGLAEWTIPGTSQRSMLTLFGVDPTAETFKDAGLQADVRLLLQADSALFDQESRGSYRDLLARLRRQESVSGEVNGQSIRVERSFRLGASFLADSTLICSEETFMRIFRGRTNRSVSVGLLQIEAGLDPDLVASKLRSALPGDDVRIMTIDDYIAFEKQYLLDNQPIGFVFIFGVIMGLVVGFAILYQILFTDVNDHLAEYATFRAMGFTHKFLLSIVFEQALILAMIGFIPGLLISLGLYQLTSIFTALPIAMLWSRPAAVLLMTLVMCAVSGTVAARKLKSADPADMF